MKKFSEGATLSSTHQPLISVDGRTYSAEEVGMIISLAKQVVLCPDSYEEFCMLHDQLRRFILQEGN